MNRRSLAATRWGPVLLLALAALGVGPAPARSATTPQEVVSEYAVMNRLDDTVSLHYFSLDLDRDGLAELLVTDSTADNAKAGNTWTVYRNRAGAFVELDGSMDLRLDALAAGVPEGTSQVALVSYHPGSAESGQLHGYVLAGDEIQEIEWGEVRAGQPLSAVYDRLFDSESSDASVSVASIDVKDFREAHRATFDAAIARRETAPAGLPLAPPSAATSDAEKLRSTGNRTQGQGPDRSSIPPGASPIPAPETAPNPPAEPALSGLHLEGMAGPARWLAAGATLLLVCAGVRWMRRRRA